MTINLTQLHTDLTAEVAGGAQLNLTSTNAEQEQLVNFLATVPDAQLSINPVTLTLNGAGDELTVAGTLTTTWDVRGWNSDGIALTAVHIRYFQDGGTTKVDMSFTGSVQVGSRTVPMAGILQADGHVTFNSNPTDTAAISLVNIANFVSNNRLGGYLPEGYDTFDQVPLTQLTFQVGFARSAQNTRVFNTDIPLNWDLVPGKVEIKSVGMGLRSENEFNRADKFIETFGGNVHGTFVLGTEFDVRVNLSSGREWLIQFIPKDGSILPGLDNLAGLVGGNALQSAVSSGTSNMGLQNLSLDYVGVGVSKEGEVKRTEMRGHVTFYDIRFNARLYLPSFDFLGELSSTTPVHLKGILTKFFPGAAAFPEIDLSSLRASLRPRPDIYTLHAEIDTDWDLHVGSSVIGIKALLFEIKKNKGEISGNMEGKFNFLGSEFDLYADHPEAGTGWQISGQKTGDSPIAIGTFIGDVATQFGVANHLPAALDGLTIDDLQVTFDTATKDFTFFCNTKMQLDDKVLDAVLRIELTHNGGGYTRTISGTVTIGDLRFDLVFNQATGQDDIYLASYQNRSGKSEDLHGILSTVTSNTAILDAAAGMTFQLKDALLVVDKGSSTRLLFGMDINGGIDLSKMPLVGKFFPANSSLRMTLQPLVTNANFVKADLDKVRPLVPDGGYQLPEAASDRLALNMQLQIGGQVIDLDLPIVADDVKVQPATSPEGSAPDPALPVAQPSGDGVKWYKVQKQIGPVHFARIGVHYANSKLQFLVDASISVGGLTISLDGMAVESGLNPIHPKFSLHGMGIDYKKGPLEIGGAFLRETFTDSSGNHYDSYEGAAIIRTEEFALSALGSYAFYQGHPSMFVYAFVDAPLGGPAFFFVTGAAAGFGYNRRMVVPDINGVRTFPLVEEAMAGVPGTTSDVNAEVGKLHAYIPPAVGEHFLALGLRFTSFEILDSFVLLSASLGHEFELDVLGLSTMVLPKPEPGQSTEALAEVQMALKAVFNPGKGFLKVRAALTSASYILSRACHLTGGFAFYTWFKDNTAENASAGDFVLTMGGYHPRFQRPAHYPKVAPLGFNWRVDSHINIKGDFYFALVPSAVMAGGHLRATWHSGRLKAWFDVGADFMISWKPYFYDASIHLSMGVSYTYHFFGTHHISVHVGADLHIWGPKFSGKAHVHLWIVSFNVTFGSHSKQSPTPISWNQFREGFLPPTNKWLSLKVTNGLVKQAGTDSAPIYVVNPKEFQIETHSAVPITKLELKSPVSGVAPVEKAFDANKNVHIGPMGITDAVNFEHGIKIEKGGVDYTSEFTIEPVKQNVPGALWGTKLRHSENEPANERLIENVCTGFSIRGAGAESSSQSHAVETSKLLIDREDFGTKVTPIPPFPDTGEFLKSTAVRGKVHNNIEARSAQRASLLQRLGFEGSSTPNASLSDTFILPNS